MTHPTAADNRSRAALKHMVWTGNGRGGWLLRRKANGTVVGKVWPHVDGGCSVEVGAEGPGHMGARLARLDVESAKAWVTERAS